MAQSVPPAAVKTIDVKHLGVVDPPCDVLDPKESLLIVLSCQAFQCGQEDTTDITTEWTNAPDGATKQFHREWFQADGASQRKNLPNPTEYNP